VYGILSTQLILTFGITLLFILNENIKLYIQTHPWLLYTAVGLSIVVLFTLTCFESIRRKHPTGLILLGLFTLCEAYVIGCISSFFDIDDVIIAIGITATIIIALTLFAFQTKIDFTVYTGVLLCITVGLLIFGFLQIWFRSQILHILYATLGAIVFSCYLVIDTQRLLGNKRLTIGIDDAIFAALQLYLDIINIFLFILQLCGGRNE
jgi:FtsH-binding integral membrane protein